MWIMGLAANKTILQVGSRLEDEMPLIASRQGFCSAFCLDSRVMCERPGGSLAGLI